VGPVVLAAAFLAGVQLMASGWVAAAAPANRPLYFDRLVTEADLEGRSADELRLMRNTIFARAGRAFDDPALRDYFSRQPWYRPAGAQPRKLSAIDQKNLAGIKLWETRAKALDGLGKLVPGFNENAAMPAAGYECGTDARHALGDKREQRRLVLEASRLSWADVPSFGDLPSSAGAKTKTVQVTCGPDIDADGSPEAVVTMRRTYEVPAGDESSVESIELSFLASRRGTKWRAVAPLGIDGSILGIEGSVSTSVWFVTLADGRRGLAVRRTVGGGGDCDCASEVTSVVTLEQGRLKPRGSFETGQPCVCQYADSD
jgi:hypothetical protein